MYWIIFSVIMNVKVTGNAEKNAFRVTDSEKTSDESGDSSNIRNAGATEWTKKDKGGSNMAKTGLKKKHNCQTLTCTCQSSTYSPPE
jgi:hypothetical protein